MASTIGLGTNQVPTNGMLGGMAFQDTDKVSINNLYSTSIDVNRYVSEKSYQVTFPFGTAHQKVQIYWPSGPRLQGGIEITVLSSYNYAQSSGMIRKCYGLHAAENGAKYTETTRVPYALGPVASWFTISDFQWDSVNRRWFVVIANLAGTTTGSAGNSGNTVGIHVKTYLGNPWSFGMAASETNISDIYSTDTTIFPQLFHNIPLNFGVGTSAPVSRLHVLNPTGGSGTTEVSTIERDNSGYFFKLHRNAGSGNLGALIGADSVGGYFAGGHNTRNMLYIDSPNEIMQFYTANAERARFNSTGAFVLAGGTTNANGIGIAFPATQSASTDANTLDDYEEGTWTPSYKATTTDPSITYENINRGKYIKIGRQVYIQVTIQSTFVSSAGSGNLFIGGLPYTPQTDSFGGYSSFAVSNNTAINVGTGERVSVYLDGGDARIYLLAQNDDTSSYANLTGAAINSNPSSRYLFFSGCYLTAS